MDFRRIRYFLQVADEGSLTRAAEVLGIAQPALSRQMRLLEEALAVRLFVRTPRGMQLTEDGEQLRAAVIGPMKQVEVALHNVGSRFAPISGGIVLGMPETTACVLAPSLLRALHTAFPLVNVAVVAHDSHRLVSEMLTGDVDIALIHGPTPDERLFDSELLSEDLVLVGGRASGLSTDRPVRFADIASLPLTLPRSQPGLRSSVEKIARQMQIKIDVRFEADSLMVRKDLIASDLAYGLLPVSAIRGELASGTLRYAPLRDPSLEELLVMAVRPKLILPRKFMLEFSSLIRCEVEALVTGGAWAATLCPSPR
jgi:LysR family nitrogen assimilation transcriptional regulator